MKNLLRKVLVTGAAGFVGGWIVECFHNSGIPVRAGIRRWNSASRLVRRPVEIVPCDVLFDRQLRSAMSECDSVVNCAVGNEQVTVEGTRNVLRIAQEMGLRRVVHISSVAVYGRTGGPIDESSQRLSHVNAYAKQKIAAEQVCESFVSDGLPVVTLRPSIIYGPFSYTWTISFANRLCSGQWGTFGTAGEGKCNLVYASDVVQAVFRSLVSDGAVGQTFNVNGNEVISWNDYFTRFNEALGQPPLKQLETRSLALKSRLMAPVRIAGRFALNNCQGLLMKLNSRSALAAKYMKATESSLKLTPTSDQIKLFGLDAEYRIDKARDQIAFEPQVNIATGLAYSVAWLKQHGLLF